MEGFWNRVDKSGECWIWTGATTGDGYGVVRAFGEPERAHRVAYVLEYGRIPDDLLVCHHCDTRACVRPDHLFVGTVKDNNDDMWRKDRGCSLGRPGESNPLAKITEEDVIDIRADYALGGITLESLGWQYGLGATQIGRIVRRESWTHVE